MAGSNRGGSNRGNNARRDQRNQEQQTAGAPPGPKPESGRPDSKGDKPEARGYEWTIVLGASTIVLAAATGISAYFLHSTDDTISKQLESNRIQLRAYVGLDQLQTVGTEPPDPNQTDPNVKIKGASISIAFKNFGPTPALSANPWISIKWYASETEPDFSKPEGNLSDKSSAVIAPGQSVTVGNIFVSQSDLQKTAISNGNIFLWGDVAYSDAFPDTPVHTFHFCDIVVGSGQITVNIVVPLVFKAYKPECNYSR
jgi:hypothetical protein